MKKIMFALAIAAIAVCGQAGTVNWSAANIYDGDTKVTSSVGAYTGILCLFTDSTGVSKDALSAFLADSNNTVEQKLAKISSATVAGSAVSPNTAGAFSLPGTSAVAADAGTYSAYAIIFDAANFASVTGDTHYMLTTVTSVTIPSAGNKTAALGSQSAFKGQEWSSVSGSSDPTPEPTSGLLLLVGAGMLALRRRRA